MLGPMSIDEVPIREGLSSEDRAVAAFFRRMWLDNGVSTEHIRDDWEARCLAFLERGRSELGLRTFFAGEERPVGCAVCQRYDGLYPDVLAPELRRYGYVWGVYVEPERRRAGLGRRLTERSVEALREAGATHVLLNAAPDARTIYERLGFEPHNEMRLALG